MTFWINLIKQPSISFTQWKKTQLQFKKQICLQMGFCSLYRQWSKDYYKKSLSQRDQRSHFWNRLILVKEMTTIVLLITQTNTLNQTMVNGVMQNTNSSLKAFLNMGKNGMKLRNSLELEVVLKFDHMLRNFLKECKKLAG